MNKFSSSSQYTFTVKDSDGATGEIYTVGIALFPLVEGKVAYDTYSISANGVAAVQGSQSNVFSAYNVKAFSYQTQKRNIAVGIGKKTNQN